jgi:hypothetical protein
MIFLQAIPEKQPALLSLVYMGGLALMVLLLAISLFRYARRRRSALASVAPEDLPEEVRQRLGVTSTNRGLRALRWVFTLLALAVFGFHVYWAWYAEQSNERFQELSYKDLRNRRLAESTLRGWILDRSGSLDRALALYHRGPDGRIVREYPLDREMAQLFGSDRGDAGLERALFGVESGAAPEALDVVMERDIKQAGNLDVRLTIDSELQKTVVEQLRDRHGAVVALNPQTGEVLAMYSNPSYSLREAQDEEMWIRLDTNKRDLPLVNRALRAYYIPGSTFKTVTMIAAYVAGIQDSKLNCSGSGYVAARGANPIFDDQGPGEVHGTIGMDTAYEVSCNQYFAQLAVKLGADRMRQAAELLGIGAWSSAEEARVARRQVDLWNTSRPSVARALAPTQSTMVTSPRMSAFDLALEGYGQGYAGQMTPFQMALAAAAIANMEGRLMKPKIEYDVPPAVYNQIVSPQHAADMRRIMGLVTMGPSGTARGAFAPVNATGLTSGGKTGTAQKDVPLYDPKTGEIKTVKKQEKDRRGNVIREYEQIVLAPEPRIDSWFLCIAPLERPQIVIAVIIEGGGYGSKQAAPLAANVVLKARELGLLGVAPAPAPQIPVPQPEQQQQPPRPNSTPPARPRANRTPPPQTARR